MNKYRNRKTVIDNVTFDSKREAERYFELKMLLKIGKIKNLKLQPKFTLLDPFVDAKGVKHRGIEYRADFAYLENNVPVVEDSKGVRTEVYKLKLKLFLSKYRNVRFAEV